MSLIEADHLRRVIGFVMGPVPKEVCSCPCDYGGDMRICGFMKTCNEVMAASEEQGETSMGSFVMGRDDEKYKTWNRCKRHFMESHPEKQAPLLMKLPCWKDKNEVSIYRNT